MAICCGGWGGLDEEMERGGVEVLGRMVGLW